MKPLKIVAIKDHDQDDQEFVVFIRPDAVSMAMHVEDHPDLCGIKSDGHDNPIIIKEPLLEFVARWSLALM